MTEDYSSQAIAKAIVPKVPGLLSAFASSFIIYDIMQKKKSASIRNRLLIGLSISDMIGSIAFGFISSWAIPRGTPGVYLAAGNEATCKAQGFLLQLCNTTSPLYSGSLSFYYLVTVSKGWSDEDVKKYQPLMHFIPIFFGIATAAVGLGLDLYHPVGLWCWFGPPGPHYDIFRWAMAHSFIWSTIFFGSYVMIVLYRKVRALEKKSSRWLQSGQTPRRKHSRNVAIQGILFSGAYFLAYIGGFLTRFVQSLTGKVYFQLIIIMAALLPAQGIFNFLVYMRPRWQKLNASTYFNRSFLGRMGSSSWRVQSDSQQHGKETHQSSNDDLFNDEYHTEKSHKAAAIAPGKIELPPIAHKDEENKEICQENHVVFEEEVICRQIETSIDVI